MGHGLARGVLSDLLRGEGRALARAFESNATSGGPAEQISLHVGDRHLRVVECRQDVRDANRDVLGAFSLDDLFGTSVLTEQFGSGGSGGSGDRLRRLGRFATLRRFASAFARTARLAAFGG